MLVACPRCQRTFPSDSGAFCPEDATALKPIDEVPVASDPSDPLVGFTLADHYQIRRIVAEGSMGRVYEARDTRDQRRLALKILHPQVAEDQVNIERFRREATTSKDLDHAYIVDVHDFANVPTAPGRTKRTWYLAMEYLDGEELRALQRREKRLGLAKVIRITSQLALALDPAHAAGYVHRDLKPDNVFLVRDGDDVRVKLLDFGSVKFTKGQDRGHKLTVLGTTIGSPFYMSPEQAQGAPDLDHRADTWAITAIVYEMLVGRVPFQGTNGPQILFRILSDEPEPPTFVNESLPSKLDEVLMKGMRKKTDERYQSVGALADALGHAFGLEGDHKDWAKRASSELEAALTAAGGAAPSEPPPPKPAPATKVDAPTPASSATTTSDDEVLERVAPKSPLPVPVLVAVGLGVLAVVAYLLVR